MTAQTYLQSTNTSCQHTLSPLPEDAEHKAAKDTGHRRLVIGEMIGLLQVLICMEMVSTIQITLQFKHSALHS